MDQPRRLSNSGTHPNDAILERDATDGAADQDRRSTRPNPKMENPTRCKKEGPQRWSWTARKNHDQHALTSFFPRFHRYIDEHTNTHNTALTKGGRRRRNGRGNHARRHDGNAHQERKSAERKAQGRKKKTKEDDDEEEEEQEEEDDDGSTKRR